MKSNLAYAWQFGLILLLSFTVGWYAWTSVNNLPTVEVMNVGGVNVKPKIVLPRLEGNSDKEIQNKVNQFISEIERNMTCFSGDEANASGRETSWATDAKVTKNGDGIFSMNIHSSYNCGGPYPTDDYNQSITFDLRNGVPVQFEELFSNWNKDKAKIISVIYEEQIAKAKTEAQREGECYSNLDSFLNIPEFNYSITDDNITVQQLLPHVIAACSFEQTVPIKKLKAYVNPMGILGWVK